MYESKCTKCENRYNKSHYFIISIVSVDITHTTYMKKRVRAIRTISQFLPSTFD